MSLPDRAAYRMSVTLLATVLAAFLAKILLRLSGDAAGWPGPAATFGLGVTGLLAGALLVALPLRAAVPPVAATMAAAGLAAHLLGQGAAAVVNYTISTLVSGLVVYGLVKLARSVRDLQAAGEELARAATVQERLRAARDLHDLLGEAVTNVLRHSAAARCTIATSGDGATVRLVVENDGLDPRARPAHRPVPAWATSPPAQPRTKARSERAPTAKAASGWRRPSRRPPRADPLSARSDQPASRKLEPAHFAGYARRVREFLRRVPLRLAGATRRQLARMLGWETGAVVLIAGALGTALAAAVLTAFARGMTGGAPHVPPGVHLAVLALGGALALAATALPARLAMAVRPADAVGVRE